MYCFVPDGNRIVKLKDLLLINSINTPNPDRKQQVIKIIESIRAGDEIILINMTTNSVYIAVVKLVTNNENDDNSYKIYINKLRKIGKNKPTAIRSLIFKTQIENLVDTYKPVRKPKKYHYKNIKNETYKGIKRSVLYISNIVAYDNIVLCHLETLSKNMPQKATIMCMQEVSVNKRYF